MNFWGEKGKIFGARENLSCVCGPVAKEFEHPQWVAGAGPGLEFVHPEIFDLIKKLLPLQVLVSFAEGSFLGN